MNIWVIFITVMGLSWIVSATLKSKFRKNSKIPVENGMTGREIAEKMLHDNGIFDVSVVSVPGQLTDHYNPEKKSIILSRDVYASKSIAAAAVAAHETGHAVQHANAYAWLGLRSRMVPVVSFSSKWVTWVILAGILMIKTFPALLFTGIVLFALTTLFSFVTLPVEFTDSQRALVWLSGTGITSLENQAKARDALKWAALTYVVAAVGSLATLLYYIMIFTGARD